MRGAFSRTPFTRSAGLENLEQVKWAILEPDGEITFIPKASVESNPASTHKKGAVA